MHTHCIYYLLLISPCLKTKGIVICFEIVLFYNFFKKPCFKVRVLTVVYGIPGCGWSSPALSWLEIIGRRKTAMAAEIHSRPQSSRPVLLNKIEGHSDAVNAAVLIPKEDGVITVSEDRYITWVHVWQHCPLTDPTLTLKLIRRLFYEVYVYLFFLTWTWVFINL